jgi:hypothetical protein
MKMLQMIHSMKPTIVKNKLRIFFAVSALLIFNSCYFPGYQSVAETSLHNISFAEGKWFVNYVTILNSKNLKESLSLLKATKTIDYVIQITGSIGANEIGNINIKPMKNAEKTAASITFKVYEVSTEQLVYSHTTTGQLTVENNSEDVLFGKSAQNIMKKCLKKGMKQLKKSGGCEK